MQATKPMRVMFARFPGGGSDRAEVTDWLIRAVSAAKADSRIDSDILNWRISDTPITMGRNRCIEVAQESEVDYLVMVDNDMAPDLYLHKSPINDLVDPCAQPFFESSFDFLYQRRDEGPAVIAAPYCGPPPHENVYVFQWRDEESDAPEDSQYMSLEQFTREQASVMEGITEVAALPTGLILLDMRAIAHTDPPYFYYEWKDEKETAKASTEDVTFTRDLSLNGVPQFCNWQAWAGHWKQKCVGRPRLLSPQGVNRRFKRRVLAEQNIHSDEERLIFVGKDRNGQAQNGQVQNRIRSESPRCPEPGDVTVCE